MLWTVYSWPLLIQRTPAMAALQRAALMIRRLLRAAGHTHCRED